MSVSVSTLSKYCLPINQERGVMKRRETRGMRDAGESREWDKSKIKVKEYESVVVGGFWKAIVKSKK
jgi:hypothetical protein